MTKAKIMCVWCQRLARQPHLDNCPCAEGAPQCKTNHGLMTPSKRNRATYLRRSMSDLKLRNVLPRVMYLVENDIEPDSPKDLYEFDKQMGW